MCVYFATQQHAHGFFTRTRGEIAHTWTLKGLKYFWAQKIKIYLNMTMCAQNAVPKRKFSVCVCRKVHVRVKIFIVDTVHYT